MSTRIPTLDEGYVIPDEEKAAKVRQRESYEHLLGRLSHQSVVKHFDAYADIDWDSDESRIEPDDPRWELGSEHILGETEWYQSQPAEIRSRMGLHMVATFMKLGLQFEAVLKRGLWSLLPSCRTAASSFVTSTTRSSKRRSIH